MLYNSELCVSCLTNYSQIGNVCSENIGQRPQEVVSLNRLSFTPSSLRLLVLTELENTPLMAHLSLRVLNQILILNLEDISPESL